jgi:hypothetical protein
MDAVNVENCVGEVRFETSYPNAVVVRLNMGHIW